MFSEYDDYEVGAAKAKAKARARKAKEKDKEKAPKAGGRSGSSLEGALVTRKGRIHRGTFRLLEKAEPATRAKDAKKRKAAKTKEERKKAAKKVIGQALIPIVGLVDVDDWLDETWDPQYLDDLFWEDEISGCIGGFGDFLKSVGNVAKDVIKSPVTKAVAGGVALAFPPVGVPATAALVAADRVVRSTESATESIREAGKQVVKNTIDEAKKGDEDAKRALEVVKVAKKTRDERVKRVTPKQKEAIKRTMAEAKKRRKGATEKAADVDGRHGKRKASKSKLQEKAGKVARAKAVAAKTKLDATEKALHAVSEASKAKKSGRAADKMKAHIAKKKADDAAQRHAKVKKVEKKAKEDLATELNVLKGALVTQRGRIKHGRWRRVAA
jgi:hypothetical protein